MYATSFYNKWSCKNTNLDIIQNYVTSYLYYIYIIFCIFACIYSHFRISVFFNVLRLGLTLTLPMMNVEVLTLYTHFLNVWLLLYAAAFCAFVLQDIARYSKMPFQFKHHFHLLNSLFFIFLVRMYRDSSRSANNHILPYRKNI